MPNLNLKGWPVFPQWNANGWYPTRQQTLEKLVSRLRIDKSERISEALASMHETSQHSFETDNTNLLFSYKSVSLAQDMEYHVLVP